MFRGKQSSIMEGRHRCELPGNGIHSPGKARLEMLIVQKSCSSDKRPWRNGAVFHRDDGRMCLFAPDPDRLALCSDR